MELKLTFLGTGSGRPTPRRNVAGLFLQYGSDALQFDCGEGSQMQVLRAGLKTSRLRAICITHFHGDHINGLPGYLGTMGLNGHEEPLTIAGPRGLDRYLHTLRELAILRPAFPLDVVDNNAGVVFEGEGYTIDAVRVRHRIKTHAFRFREHDLVGRFDVEAARSLGVTPGPDFGKLQRGLSVETPDGTVVRPEQVLGKPRRGRVVCYATDTRPCDAVIEFAADADILIHEATYLGALADQAHARGHSTVREAAEVAREAGVGRLILTHVSPKHTSRREIVDEARAIFPESVLAEDLDSFDVDVPA